MVCKNFAEYGYKKSQFSLYRRGLGIVHNRCSQVRESKMQSPAFEVNNWEQPANMCASVLYKGLLNAFQYKLEIKHKGYFDDRGKY